MVDVGYKDVSFRRARAESVVILNREAYENVVRNTASKGSVITVAQIAGIQGAKQTSNLIPLCHQINLNKVDISFSFLTGSDNSPADVSSGTSVPTSDPHVNTAAATKDPSLEMLPEAVSPPASLQSSPDVSPPTGYQLRITCTVTCVSRTGVEMEALVGASVAALTVYDMCKAVDKTAVISDTRLVYKEGGKSGVFSVE